MPQGGEGFANASIEHLEILGFHDSTNSAKLTRNYYRNFLNIQDPCRESNKKEGDLHGGMSNNIISWEFLTTVSIVVDRLSEIL